MQRGTAHMRLLVWPDYLQMFVSWHWRVCQGLVVKLKSDNHIPVQINGLCAARSNDDDNQCTHLQKPDLQPRIMLQVAPNSCTANAQQQAPSSVTIPFISVNNRQIQAAGRPSD
jgi:hypothetical protein